MNAITRIEEIVEEISTKLDVIQKESVCVGSLLIEAKEELTEKGGTYAQFIEWCGLNFSIGKAQASKLMKVATVFSEDKRFSGVAMRVLYSLACNATPEQMDRAAEFAANDSLDSAVLNQLLNPKPEVEKVVEKELVTTDEVTEQQKELEATLKNIPAKEVSQSETPANNEEKTALTSEIQELRKALEAANSLIKEMKDSKVKHNDSKSMPMLPQFHNACPYAVLGLGQVEAKKITVVKKAFRELIKCGYGSGHEAFELLTGAKDQLLKDIEEAKKTK